MWTLRISMGKVLLSLLLVKLRDFFEKFLFFTRFAQITVRSCIIRRSRDGVRTSLTHTLCTQTITLNNPLPPLLLPLFLLLPLSLPLLLLPLLDLASPSAFATRRYLHSFHVGSKLKRRRRERGERERRLSVKRNRRKGIWTSGGERR
jgi:hypothetical protein